MLYYSILLLTTVIVNLRAAMIMLSGVWVALKTIFRCPPNESRTRKMRIIGKSSRLVFLQAGLAFALLQGMAIKAHAEDTLQVRNDAYVEQVVGILRSHVLSMRMILDHDDLKYADNMVRHAEAFGRAFGMVGPMEWHVAEAFSYAQKRDSGEKLTEKQFEELAENTRIAIYKIKRSAVRYGRDKNKELMRASINRMIESCGACHSKFPEGTVPSVWKGMKE